MLIKKYQSTTDIESVLLNETLNTYPESLSRNEGATGLLIRGIFVNGNYLITESCSLQPVQEINQIWAVYGGPNSAIADIGIKKLEGELVVPIFLNRDGTIDPAIKAIMQVADIPLNKIRIDTNYALSHFDLTASDDFGYGATDNNELLSFDSVVVKKLSIRADKSNMKMTVSFVGMIDTRSPSNLIAPPTDYRLKRQLSLQDCQIYRYESFMRNVASFEIIFDNQFETPAFIESCLESARTDQISLIGLKQRQCSGNVEQTLRVGVEKETFIHGGLMSGENLTFDMGGVKAIYTAPLFKMGQQNFVPGLIRRKTEFLAQLSPILSSNKGNIFNWV